MSDLINRQDAIDAVNKTIAQYVPYLTRKTNGIPLEVALAIKRLPSAQRKGEWVWVQYDANPELGNFHCSECHFIPACFNWSRKHLNFCPNCGADMRGEEDE